MLLLVQQKVHTKQDNREVQGIASAIKIGLLVMAGTPCILWATDVLLVERQCSSGTELLFQITILEALAASGLRSIRYALEIDGVERILANDYSVQAVETMKENVERNKVGHVVTPNKGEAA